MLEEIKNLVYSKYKAEDKNWLFFSLFDDKWNLITSNGVLTSDKSLEETITLIYNWIIIKEEKNIKHIIIDIVNEVTEQKDVNAFLKMDPKTNWVLLIETKWDKTWVMLPNMKWVTSMTQVVAWIKSKYQLQWDVAISTFTVTELILNR